MEAGKIVGALRVDATKGEFNKFQINERQIVFPESLFQRREVGYSDTMLQDTTKPNQPFVIELTPEGRKLYDALDALGGKGVTLTGQLFARQVRFTQDFSVPQYCVYVQAVEANPAADPPLAPHLVDLLREKAKKDAAEVAQRKAEKMAALKEAEELEAYREELREARQQERKRKQPA